MERLPTKIISALLAAVLLVTALPAALAAGSITITMKAPGSYPAAGSTFSATVSITGNPGVNAVQFSLYYDNTVVECQSVTAGPVVQGMLKADNPHAVVDGGSCAMLATASTETTGSDGVIATLQFRMLRDGDPALRLADVDLRDADSQVLPFTIRSDTASSTDAPAVVKPDAPQDAEWPETKITFPDVPAGHWAAEYVASAAKAGLVKGYSDGLFHPDASVTRAQFVTILWRMAGSPEASQAHTFQDVPQGAYYEQAVRWALEKGYTNGTSDTAFSPNGNITREQAVAILSRYNGGSGGMETMLTGIYDSQFTDSASISGYAKPAVYWAIYHGIITGSTGTTISPQGTATRAQIAAIFLRYMNQTT